MTKCDLCGERFTAADGSPGGPNDCLMVNDYVTMTDWYRNHRPESFRVKAPNPWACRACVRLLVHNGLARFVGGDAEAFLVG